MDSKRIYALYYSVFCASDRPWVAWLPWKLPWNALVGSSTCAHTSEHTRQLRTPPFAVYASSAVFAFRDLFIVARSPCGCPGSNSLTHTSPFTPRNGDHLSPVLRRPSRGLARASSPPRIPNSRPRLLLRAQRPAACYVRHATTKGRQYKAAYSRCRHPIPCDTSARRCSELPGGSLTHTTVPANHSFAVAVPTESVPLSHSNPPPSLLHEPFAISVHVTEVCTGSKFPFSPPPPPSPTHHPVHHPFHLPPPPNTSFSFSVPVPRLPALLPLPPLRRDPPLVPVRVAAPPRLPMLDSSTLRASPRDPGQG